jgi:hypothetical protein
VRLEIIGNPIKVIHRVSRYNLYGKIQWISSVWMTTSCHRTHPNTRGRCHGRRGVSVREGRGTPAFPPALGAHRAVFACGRPAPPCETRRAYTYTRPNSACVLEGRGAIERAFVCVCVCVCVYLMESNETAACRQSTAACCIRAAPRPSLETIAPLDCYCDSGVNSQH